MKKFICIECPKGCHLTVKSKDGKVTGVLGNQCKKGKHYAVAEVEAPMRFLSSTVLALGLEMKMVPIKTDKPVPKERIFDVMKAIRKFRLMHAVRCQEVLIENVLGLGVNIVATREVKKK